MSPLRRSHAVRPLPPVRARAVRAVRTVEAGEVGETGELERWLALAFAGLAIVVLNAVPLCGFASLTAAAAREAADGGGAAGMISMPLTFFALCGAVCGLLTAAGNGPDGWARLLCRVSWIGYLGAALHLWNPALIVLAGMMLAFDTVALCVHTSGQSWGHRTSLMIVGGSVIAASSVYAVAGAAELPAGLHGLGRALALIAGMLTLAQVPPGAILAWAYRLGVLACLSTFGVSALGAIVLGGAAPLPDRLAAFSPHLVMALVLAGCDLVVRRLHEAINASHRTLLA